MPRLGRRGTAVSVVPTALTIVTRNAPLGVSAGSATRRDTGDSTAEHPMSSAVNIAVGSMSDIPRWADGAPGPGRTKRRTSGTQPKD